MRDQYTNPVINSDFPDPDIIRVGDTYYMASTTMYFMPGGDILRSSDLVHWEFVCHAFGRLEENSAHCLEDGQQIYGQGMWAPSLRFRDGVFYLTFACNDTHKSLLFKALDPVGPWERLEMGGFFYDSSLFFDDDGRVYIVHGNTQLRITELETGTWGPKPGGLDRVIVTDCPGQTLGYEGSHLYKKDGRYYLFTCHMPQGSKFLKTEDCFLADSLSGPWRGRNILDDNMGYRDFGVAQGGMVDTPEGDWYAFMFQDRGPLGRAPVVMPMTFDGEGFPVLGDNGRVPQLVSPVRTGGVPACAPLNGSDDFRYVPDEKGAIHLAHFWQFSHNPDPEGWSVTAQPGAFRLTSRRTSPNLILARNTLTQRCVGPQSAAWVTLDGSGLGEGDYAGICAYQGCYGAIALTRRNGAYWLVMLGRPADDSRIEGDFDFGRSPVEYAQVPAARPVVTLRVNADFSCEPDTAEFFYLVQEGVWRSIGIRQQLHFKLDLFTGCRFGLFCYSTLEPGGTADFSEFHFQGPDGEDGQGKCGVDNWRL